MRISLLAFFLFGTTLAPGQNLGPISLLSQEIEESSGLLWMDGRLLSHEDSGNEAAIVEVDTLTGEILRKVIIENASQEDWEDMAMDGESIYIGDFGNNAGIRQDLKIYRIAKSDYLQSQNDTVSAEVIGFSYADQLIFEPAQFTTNFDAEALISIGDSLYIFTKNWGNNLTYVYALPKIPGIYSTPKIDSLNAGGLITGADYNPETYQLVLSGYNLLLSPFCIRLSELTGAAFSSANFSSFSLSVPAGYSGQIEGITNMGQNRYLLSSESSFTGTAGLMWLVLPDVLSTSEKSETENLVYPNPASGFVQVRFGDFETIDIYNPQGIQSHTINSPSFDVSDWNSGSYLLVFKNIKGFETGRTKLMVIK